jgi:ABC-2 type transport system ATP-binding protein
MRYKAEGRPAVDGIDLRAEAGEVLVVLGPNGAGKTSTVEVLEGYRRPAAGTVRVLGLDPIAEHRRVAERIGVMLQRGGVYPMLGPRRVLDLFAAYYDDPVPPDELLELVGLRGVAGTPWRHLSGGEQQRLSLALALVGRPEVAFLDEPTAGVDPEGRLAIRAVIGDLKDERVCVVVTTHELAEAEATADRIVILAAGRVALEGTPGELASRATVGEGPRLTFGATPGLDTAALAAAVGPGTAVMETSPGRYRVEGEKAAGPAGAASVATWLADKGVALGDMTVGRTLEDVYFDAVGAAAQQVADGEDDTGSVDGRRARRQQRSRRRHP